LEYKKGTSTHCKDIKPVGSRKDREPPPSLLSEKYNEEYWLKIILKLRLAESEFAHDVYNFGFFSRSAIYAARLLGTDAALNYINDLTKGISVTKFIRKGKYWYGLSETEYQKRKSLSSFNSP
jgi:hypothetical protein